MFGAFFGILAIALTILTTGAAASDNWTDIAQRVRRPPTVGDWSGTSSNLRAILALSRGRTLLAVGERGTVMRSEDGGESWRYQATAIIEDLRGIVGLPDGQTIIAVGANGVVLRSLDAGVSWQSASPKGTVSDLQSVTSLGDGKTLTAVGDKGNVLRSQDAGQTWVSRTWGQRTERSSGRQLNDVLALPEERLLFAVGANGIILRSMDMGLQWEVSPNRTPQQLWKIAAQPRGGC
jgi:photosystem II stability/assembly factor-like uncharacterized protein